jgi:hypothetical protein
VPYRIVASEWHDFYIVAGAAAATLVGLLFVGLSLHLRVVVTRSEVRSLARVTLANFGLLLLVSVFMVAPQGSAAAGNELLFSGAISAALVAPSVISAGRSRTRTLELYRLLARFGVSLFGYVGVFVAGILIARRSFETAFHWLIVVTVVLIVVSLRNSWDLLVSVGEATLNGERDPEE